MFALFAIGASIGAIETPPVAAGLARRVVLVDVSDDVPHLPHGRVREPNPLPATSEQAEGLLPAGASQSHTSRRGEKSRSRGSEREKPEGLKSHQRKLVVNRAECIPCAKKSCHLSVCLGQGHTQPSIPIALPMASPGIRIQETTSPRRASSSCAPYPREIQ